MKNMERYTHTHNKQEENIVKTSANTCNHTTYTLTQFIQTKYNKKQP